MNELASPPRVWDTPRVIKERTLFVIDNPVDNPVNNDWTSEPYE